MLVHTASRAAGTLTNYATKKNPVVPEFSTDLPRLSSARVLYSDQDTGKNFKKVLFNYFPTSKIINEGAGYRENQGAPNSYHGSILTLCSKIWSPY